MRPMNPAIKQLAQEMGQPPYAIRKWKMRGAVPHVHRLPMILKAAEKGLAISIADFDFGKPSKRRKRRAA